MLYKFQFTRQRFAKRIPLGKKEYFNLDINNGFFTTEDDAVGKAIQAIAADPKQNKDHEIVDITGMQEKVEHALKPKNKVIAGARSSKDSGE